MNQSFGQDTRSFIITHGTLYISLLVGISVIFGCLLFLVKPIFLLGIILGLVFCLFILTYPYIGLLIYFATFVMQPGALFPSLAVLHIERVFGLLVLLSMLVNIRLKKSKLSFTHNRINCILLAFLVVMGLSVFTSFWPTQSVETTIDFGKTLIFYFLIVNLLTNGKRLKIFIREYVLLTGWLCFTSLKGYFSGKLIVAQGIERAYGITGTDPNTLAVSLVLAIPFLYFLLFAEKSKWLRILSVSILLACLATVILTGSRGAFLGLATTGFLIWLRSKQKALVLTILLLIGTTTWLLMPEKYKERYETILTTTTRVDDSSQGRINAWKAGMRMFYDRPILGVGAGAFGTAHATGYTPEGKRQSWLQSHSVYVQVLSELGILGFAVFFVLVYTVIRQNMKLKKAILEKFNARNWNYYLSLAMMTSLGTLFVTGIFGHSLYRFNWYFIAALTVVLVRLTAEKIESDKIKTGLSTLP